jgi:hypothetical protein
MKQNNNLNSTLDAPTLKLMVPPVLLKSMALTTKSLVDATIIHFSWEELLEQESLSLMKALLD